jgi:hypothetical protein
MFNPLSLKYRLTPNYYVAEEVNVMTGVRKRSRVARLRESVKAISPTISVLLMIAIAVVAALVAYLWIMGFLNFNTAKAGKAIQIQSVMYTGTHLVVYVQNVGQSAVTFTPSQCLYVDGLLQNKASANPTNLEQTKTASIVDNVTLSLNQKVKLKVVTNEGTWIEASFTVYTFTGDYTLSVLVVGNGHVDLVPSGQAYYYETVQLTAVADPHWTFGDPLWSGSLSGNTNPQQILMDGNKAVTVTFMPITQQITFDQSGVGTDFTGTSVTIDGTGYNVTDLPHTFTWIEASDHSFSFASPLAVDAGKQYVWASTTGLSTGQSGTVTVPSASGSVTATYGTQFYLTVSSPYGTPGGAGWYGTGATAYATLKTDTVDQGNQTRRVFTNWSGDASGTGYPQSNSITMDGAKTALATWKTQYQVAFNVAPSGKGTTNPSVTDWFDEGAPGISINATVTDFTYKFSYWSATGNIIFADSASDTTTATVNGPDTITANFAINTVDITITSNPTSNLDSPYFVKIDDVNVTTPYTISWVISSTHTLEALSPVSGTTGTQYAFTGWSDSGSQTHTYTVPNAPDTVTANYKTQHRVTFDQTGLDSTASGTVVTINGTARTYGELPNIVWVDSGDIVTYTYENIVSSSAAGTQFSLTTVTGSASPITVTSPVAVMANYQTQYLVTFAQTGLDSTVFGVLNVNVYPITYVDLPYSFWIDNGSSVTYSYYATVASSVSGKQFILNSVSGPSSPITVSGPVTVTGNYVTQYSVTFDQTGLDSTASGTVVTINGAAKAYGTLPNSTWVDSGGSVTYSYTATVPSSTSGERFHLTGVTGPSSPITVSGAITVTGNYNTQFSVTFAVNPTSPVPGTTSPSGTQWYDSGANVPITATVTNSSYLFAKWTATGSISFINASSASTTATIGGTGTITANFGLRSYFGSITSPGDITIGQSETVWGILYGPPSGSQVTLTYTRPDGSQVIRTTNTFLGAIFYDSYTPDTVGNWQLVVSYAGNSQYAPVATAPYSFSVSKISVSLSCSASPTTVGIGQSMTVSGSLTPASGSDLAGQTITLTFTKPDASTFIATAVTDSSGDYTYSYTPDAIGSWSVVASWPGDATHTSATSSPQSFTVANVVIITVTSSQTGSGFVSVDGTPITTPRMFNWVVGSTHTLFATSTVSGGTGVQYVYAGWSDGGARTHTYTVPNSGATVTAVYTTQYQLTMATNFGTVSPASGGWYNAGSTVTIQATAPSAGAGERYVWVGWTGVGTGSYTGTNNPANNAVTMNSAITETATWTRQYQVSFAVNPSGDGSTTPSGSNLWENAGSLAITATANSGYKFSSWSSDTPSITFGSQTSSTTATISGTGTITATFVVSTPTTIQLFPNGGGSNTNLNPSGASSNWRCVDDNPPDGDTTYVYRDGSSMRTDTYATQDHGSVSGTINSVTIHIVCRTTGSGLAHTVILTHGNTYTSPDFTLTGSYQDLQYAYTRNPNTNNPWTWSEIDSIEIGVALSRSSGQARCTQVYIEVNYTP